MQILKPIDEDYNCVSAKYPSDILKAIFDFNEMLYIETDIAGSQLQNLDPYTFFGVNRVLSFAPNASSLRYSRMRYNCLLTFAKPINADLEIETINVDGQFDKITKELLTLEFINTFASYFKCCDYPIEIPNVVPISNSNRAVTAINHTGVEINYTVII